jgi:CTD kinase subunit gamma
MDSFELQMQLTRLLSSLNSSKQASSEICTFLIRNYVVQEDLYPALLEVLPKLDINKRLNILQFIEDFLTLIVKDPKYQSNDIIFNYAFLIVSDLQKILQYVLPESPKSPSVEHSNIGTETDKVIVDIGKQIPSNKNSSIRTLANLPFSYEILVHISKLFKLDTLQELKDEYAANHISNEDMMNVREGKLFDESYLYTADNKPTESSHVDDYVNSSQRAIASNDDQPLSGGNVEENYIPVKIKQGLENSWKFLIGKRKQSQYESLLLDHVSDPFHSKDTEEQHNTGSLAADMRMSAKTPLTATTKTPSKPTKQSQEASSSSISSSPRNIISLTQTMILQRIEADRERQKRGKETLWEVERENNKICMSEFTYIYNTFPAFNSKEDSPAIEEMEDLYKLCTITGSITPHNTKYQTPTGPKPATLISAKTNPRTSKANTSTPASTKGPNYAQRGQPKTQPPNNKRRQLHDMVEDPYYGNGYDQHPSKRYHPDQYYDEAEWYGDYQTQYREPHQYKNTNHMKPHNGGTKPRGNNQKRRGGKK